LNNSQQVENFTTINAHFHTLSFKGFNSSKLEPPNIF
jgi:hypothetical protein